jgi:hypothetical protein
VIAIVVVNARRYRGDLLPDTGGAWSGAAAGGRASGLGAARGRVPARV